MVFYDNPENVAGYIAMCETFDAAKELPPLYTALPDGARVLELGSGPGNDLALLAKHYNVTGSDYSDQFVDHLTRRFPNTPVLKLDVETLATNGPYDALYSNKVLHHLTDEALKRSFQAQAELLNEGGLVYHLVWRIIEEMPDMDGLPFIARSATEMENLMTPYFETLSITNFAEFSENDSIAILARKTKN